MDQITTQDFQDSDKASLVPSQTESYSSLSESRGLIVENIDGTYCQGKF